MAGLLGRQQQQPQPGGEMINQPAEEQEEQSNVTPEEQKEYDDFVTNGMTLMYDKKVMPQLLESVSASEDPAQGIGNALAMLVMRLEDSAQKSGREISGDVKLHGAKELVEQLIELVEEAGLHEFSETEMESALYSALDTYRSTRQEQGKLPQEPFEEEMQELAAADQQGRIDELLPGVSEYAQRAQQEGGDQPA